MKLSLIEVLVYLAFVACVGGCCFNIWARFLGPCAQPVAMMPGWCLGLMHGAR